MKLQGDSAKVFLNQLEIALEGEDLFSIRDTQVWVSEADGSSASHRLMSCRRTSLGGYYSPLTWGDEIFIDFACGIEGGGSLQSHTRNGRKNADFLEPQIIEGPPKAENRPCFFCSYKNVIEEPDWPNPRWFTNQPEFTAQLLGISEIEPGLTSLGFAQPVYLGGKPWPSLNDLTLGLYETLGPIGAATVLPFCAPIFDIEWEWKFTEDQQVLTNLAGTKHETVFNCLNCQMQFEVNLGLGIRQWGFTKQLLMNGATLVCDACSQLRHGKKYSQTHQNTDAMSALVSYFDEFGELPTPSWMDTPLFMRTAGKSFTNESLEILVAKRLKVLANMPAQISGGEGSRESDSYWMGLLSRAGLIQSVSRGTFGVTAVANDGHFCRSLLEYEFCNFLYKHGIDHESEPFYNDGSRRRADYRIGRYFVEIAGLMDEASYRTKMKVKFNSAKENKIKLAILLPVDVKQVTRQDSFSAADFEKFLEQNLGREDLFSA